MLNGNARAGIDYYVAIEKNYYSVPYRFLKETIDVGIPHHHIKIWHIGKSEANFTCP